MSKFKAAAGLFVMIGIPLALASIFAALGYGYQQQHVHDVWAEIQGNTAVLKSSDYHHSTGGVEAVSGSLALAWVLLTVMFVLIGGKMFSLRNKEWDC